jgi:hypothetical protein
VLDLEIEIASRSRFRSMRAGGERVHAGIMIITALSMGVASTPPSIDGQHAAIAGSSMLLAHKSE